VCGPREKQSQGKVLCGWHGEDQRQHMGKGSVVVAQCGVFWLPGEPGACALCSVGDSRAGVAGFYAGCSHVVIGKLCFPLLP
jgi:hypothetical protein